MMKNTLFLLLLVVFTGCVSLPGNKFSVTNDDFKKIKVVKLDVYNTSSEEVEDTKMLFQTTFVKKLKNNKIIDQYIYVKVGVPVTMTGIKDTAYVRVNNKDYKFKLEAVTGTTIVEISSDEDGDISSSNYNMLKGKIIVNKDLKSDILASKNITIRIYSGDQSITSVIDEKKYSDVIKFANEY